MSNLSTIEQKKADYRTLLYKRNDDYVKGVTDGSTIVCEKMKLAIKRYQNDLNNDAFYMNYDALDKLFNFFSYLYIDNNHNKYVPFVPEPWQCHYFVNIYGWYFTNEPEKRRINRSFLTVSRKNTKSTMAVIQALYALMKENMDAKIYIVSESKGMTTESSLAIAKNIIINSPALVDRVDTMQYSLRYKTGKSTSTLKIMPFKPTALNSLKPSYSIVDELHTMKTGEIVDKLASGMGASVNPILSIISTRGNNTTYFQYVYEQTLEKILKGEIKEEQTYIMMFEQDDETEANKPELWVKSNPMLNSLALGIDYLQNLYEKAKIVPSSLKEFFSFNLNLWVSGTEEDFIEEDLLKIAFKKGNDMNLTKEFFWGKEIYLGLDLSSREDLSSLVVLHYDKLLKEFYIFPFIYLPNNPIKKIRGRGIDLTSWLMDGFIQQCATSRIDYRDIIEDILYFKNHNCKIKCLGADSYNKDEIMPTMDAQRIKYQFVSQAIKDITQSVKLMDRIFAQEQVTCVNPAFKWMFKNIVIYKDINANIKMNKKLSRDSIDSCVAFANALELFRIDYEAEIYRPQYVPITIKI
jgi:phage terminase large subunit-like protein